ncbi:TetR/AcrR family transcriptional regulator [Nocardia sp. NPDC059180]|uniref:TetR/AcrR family transcriptional regulator n=1 Tax=Nocardia sp. NPDC059180 TaxID=3346761 RepID=UPI0036CD7EB1
MAYVKAAQREQEIVAAAVQVLSKVGVAGTTLRAVAAEAGIPLGTLHYVFASKDAMLRAVINSATVDVVTALRADAALDRGLVHAIRHGTERVWQGLVADAAGLQIMQYELAMYSVRSEGRGGLAQLQYERYTSLVADFWEQAARTAGERCAVDFATLGRLALAMMDGLIIQYLVNPDPARAQRDLNRAVDMLVAFADPQPIVG